MIRGVHGLFYSTAPEAARAFLRDLLRLPCSDVGAGWLIFDLPEGDLGVHPVGAGEPEAGTHDVSFYCDDIDGTVVELQARGVHFLAPVADHGYGYVTHFEMPGGVVVQLYEPKYTKSTRPKRARAGVKTKRLKQVQAKKRAAKAGATRKKSGRRG
jgi:predicted enzyme related to lactoylglutathione lyase